MGEPTGGWVPLAELTWTYYVYAKWMAGRATPRIINSTATVSGNCWSETQTYPTYYFQAATTFPQWSRTIKGNGQPLYWHRDRSVICWLRNPTAAASSTACERCCCSCYWPTSAWRGSVQGGGLRGSNGKRSRRFGLLEGRFRMTTRRTRCAPLAYRAGKGPPVPRDRPRRRDRHGGGGCSARTSSPTLLRPATQVGPLARVRSHTPGWSRSESFPIWWHWISGQPRAGRRPEGVGGITRLRKLDLGLTWITDAGLAPIRNLSRLEVLNFWVTGVSDAGLETLSGLTRLRDLTLAATAITDLGLKRIGKLPRLECLNLSDTRVTDAGLGWLTGLWKLRHLDLRYTRVTADGVRTLQRRCRNARLPLTSCSASRGRRRRAEITDP